MNRERLLVISPWPPPTDGIGEHTRNLVEQWAGRYEVHIIAQGRGGEETVAVGGEDVHIRRCLGRGARAVEEAIGEIEASWAYVQYSISSYGTSLRSVHRAGRVLRESGVPYSVGYHEPSREPQALPVIGGMIYRNMTGLGGRAVVFSRNGGADLKTITGQSAVVVPHGTKTVRAEPEEIEVIREELGEQTTLLVFGFIHPDKGVGHLIEAAHHLRQQGRACTVVVAGEVRERRGVFKLKERGDRRHLEELRTLAEKLGVEARFTGHVESRMIGAYLKAADLNILPYTNGTQSGVASLLVGAERGVVASDLPGLREQLGEAAVYAKAGQSEDLARAIGAALETGRRRDLEEAARGRAAETRYAEVAGRIEEITRS
jgi:glycosyltransferase involved in cell wall biosynthesis